MLVVSSTEMDTSLLADQTWSYQATFDQGPDNEGGCTVQVKNSQEDPGRLKVLIESIPCANLEVLCANVTIIKHDGDALFMKTLHGTLTTGSKRSMGEFTDPKDRVELTVTLWMCSSLVDPLAVLYLANVENPPLADLVLVCQGRHVKCHKTTLSAASAYYHSMHTERYKETKMVQLEIEGTEARILLLLVKWAYTNKLDDMPFSDLLLLMSAAARFKMSHLTAQCLCMMKMAITVANAADTFKFAFHQKLAYILEPSTAFIRLYLKQVEETIGDPPNLPD